MAVQVGFDAGAECAPWVELISAFTAVREATDRLMHAMADAGNVPDLPVGTRELEWLTQEAAQVATRGQRVRMRSYDLLAKARESGRASHDDDAQFAARKNGVDSRHTHRDAELARALGNERPATPGRGTPGTHREPGVLGAGVHEEPRPGVSGAEGPLAAADDTPPQTGEPRPLARAMDEGLVTQDHAMVILQELEAVPESTPAGTRWRAEEQLVEKARRMTPRRLRAAARRVLSELGVPEPVVDAHQDDRVRSQEERAWDAASFWMRDNGDGTVFGQFTLPVLQGRMLGKALSAMTSPRRLARKQQGGTAVPGTSWHDRQVDWTHEKGRALAELIDHLPTDHLGSSANAMVLVTTSLESLRGETDRAGVTDSGDEVSAGEVRRLAAQAGIIPVVLGGRSQVLDLGRRSRFFTENQRRALSVSYSECAEEHCDRPFAWCEIHHASPWSPARGPGGEPLSEGGPTDLANGIPLCGRHHRRLEDRRFTHTIDQDASGTATVRFHPRRPGRPPGQPPPQPRNSPPGAAPGEPTSDWP
ncbi:HNH endonuclease signature motif containing protein [Kytococcus sp. Marseille-QA3725]